MKNRNECSHSSDMGEVRPSGNQCEECGSERNLRVCMTCGHVGCCESQQGHNTLHAKKEKHPIIRSFPLSERSFTWCYECNDYLS